MSVFCRFPRTERDIFLGFIIYANIIKVKEKKKGGDNKREI